MTDDLTIRPFAPGDLPALHRIREAAFAPVWESFRSILGDALYAVAEKESPVEQGKYLDEITGEGAAHELFVACLGDAPVGFAAVKYDEAKKLGELDLNAVDPDHQGQGIGTRLYAFTLDRMRERGMRAATVGTGGDLSHAPARRAYEKAGFDRAIPNVYLYRSL